MADGVNSIGVTEARRVAMALAQWGGEAFADWALNAFAHRVSVALTHFDLPNTEALLDRLSREGRAFYGLLLARLIPPTTEMFRDPTFWCALRDEVLPRLRRDAREELRVWVAAPESGEELYSLCILLEEMGLRARCRVMATQLASPLGVWGQRVELPAKRMEVDGANYARYSGRGNFEDYTEVEAGCRYLRRELLEGVQGVEQGMRLAPWGQAPVHLILCRNFFLYLNGGLANANLHVLAGALRPGGALAVGVGERLSSYPNGSRFTAMIEHEGVYRRLKA